MTPTPLHPAGPGQAAGPGDRPASPGLGWLPWAVAGLTLAFYLATTRGYGYFRDELYYLVNGEHLGLGYVEHPPLIGWIAAAVRATLGDSLFAIRLLPALAAAATVLVVAALARELGGGRFAQGLAMLAAAVAPLYLALFSYFSMNAFDVLLWAVLWWLLARLLATGDDRLWLAFGAVAGVALLNKVSVLFLGFGVVAGLLAGRRWQVFASRRLWLGGALAAALFAPHLVWQQLHGWPTLEFMDNARRLKNVDFPPADFLAAQLTDLGMLAAPVWLAGLGWLLAARSARPWRPIGWAYLAILALLLAAGSAKPYYLGVAYTVLFAAGGVAWERWTAGRRGRVAVRSALVALAALGGVVAAPLAKPLLPVDDYVAYAAWLGETPRAEERQELSRLPQQFADMHGWPELAATVAEVYHSLPAADQARACVFGQNYGEAGAIDVLGRPLGLPPAISGHNSYFLWGPRGCSGEVMIVIGDDRERLDELFARVELGAVFHCTDCMPYEDGRSIWVARELRMPVAELWPEVKSFI